MHSILLAKGHDAANVGYVIGYVGFFVVLLAVGTFLLVTGIKARKRTSAVAPMAWQPPPSYGVTPPADGQSTAPPLPTYGEPPSPPPPSPFGAPTPETWGSPAPADPWAAAPGPTWAGPAAPPTKRTGTVRIVFGSIVLAFAVLGAIGSAGNLSSQTRDRTTIALPQTLLGLTRNDEGLAAAKKSLADSLPSGFDESDVGFYGARPHGIVVVAGRGTIRSPQAEINGFRDGVKGSGTFTVGAGTSIDPGPLGGLAQCFTTTAGTTPINVCVFVDKGSIMASFDFVATSANAAGRARTIRSLVVHRTGN